MKSPLIRVLVGSICLTLFACGGGNGAVDEPGISVGTADKGNGSTALVPLNAVLSSTYTPIDARMWEAGAAMSRREVQQNFEATAQAGDVQETAAGAKAFSAPAAPIYRFLNEKNGAHLYTRSLSERDTILNTQPQFRYEGLVYSAWSSGETGLSPVYRFVNVNTGIHFYTISESEKNNLVANVPALRLEGAAFYGSKTQVAGAVPVFRFFNLRGGFHFYTANVAERDSIIANLAALMRYEGSAYYVNQTNGVYDRALASFAGKANAPGIQNGSGENARFEDIWGMAFSPSGDLHTTEDDRSYPCSARQTRIRKVSLGGGVTDFVGKTGCGTASNDGVGSGASAVGVFALTFDANGIAYLGDAASVRKITPAGAVSTIAGPPSTGRESNGSRGYVNGQTQNARFNTIGGIAVDSTGNVFVSESDKIRKISTVGVVTTLAGPLPGSGYSGYADGIGTDARFSSLGQMVIDGANNLYVADERNNRIRKISPAGFVTTLAGQSSAGVVDGQGIAAKFDSPYAMAIDKRNGNLYVSDYEGYTVRRITPSGAVTTVVGVPYQKGVSFGSLPAGLASVGGLAIRGNRLYIASLNGVYWTNLPD